MWHVAVVQQAKQLHYSHAQIPTVETIMQVSSYIGSPVTVSQISKKMLC
jgi:hypothetical protein